MMAEPLNVMTALIGSAMLLMGVGYTQRQSNVGAGLLGAGILLMLSSLLYRLYLALY